MLGAGKRMGAQLVEQDHAEQSGFCPQNFFDIQILLVKRGTLGTGLERVTFAWPPQLTRSSVILAAGTQNTPPLKCSCHGRQGTAVGDTCSDPRQQRKNSMLHSWILECLKCLPRQQRLQHPRPPSFHELHCHPTLFTHPQINQRGNTQGLISLHVCVWCVRKAKHIFPEFQFRG